MQEINGRKVIVEISETEQVSFDVLIEFLAKGFMEYQAKENLEVKNIKGEQNGESIKRD